MKKNLFYLSMIFLVLSVVSCRPLRNLAPLPYTLAPLPYTIEPLQKMEFEQLNGSYHIFQDTVFGNIAHYPKRGIDENNQWLLSRLLLFYPMKGLDTSAIITLNFLNSKKVVVSANQNGVVLFSKNIRGKFKKGYFYLRPKIFLVPFFPVYYWHNFEGIRLGKIGNDLVVDHSVASWGFALFAGGSDYGSSTSIYKAEDK